jgi:putative lipoic acid-binding regulatory protein
LQRLELEQKLDKTIQDINKLSQKQEELTKKSESGNFGSKELLIEQEIINSDFQQIKEDIRILEKLNESLTEPMTFPDTQEQQNKIENELENSKTNLEQNKKGNAVKNQKGASEKLKELENQLSSSQDKNNEEQNQENEEHLRQILEDLISVSYSQEALMNDFKKSSASNPNFDQLGRRQKKLNHDFKIIEDSLFALSKRASQISEFINKEVGSIKIHLSNAMLEIPERHIPEINQEQHYAMTNMNNLALMLDESLSQMQQEQQQNKESKGKPKDGNCKKPGGKGKPKPSAGQLKKMQDALSKQLEGLKKQGKNQGKSGENGNPLLSKELAKAAAQQAALRKLVEDKASELNQDGSGAGNEMKQIAKEMEQIQKDIVNNAISETTLRRQQDILTRLLKAENAERTQDQDEERKSSAGHELEKQAPPGLEEYLKKKNRDLELMETMPLQLKNYYKQKSNEYLLNRFPK